MSRWRDIKQNSAKKEIEVSQSQKIDNSLLSAPIGLRIKAFVVDMFMIMMPIMYVTTYLILDGKDDFQGSDEARWITASVFGLIVIFFWVIKGQTPGFKAYSIKLVDNATEKNVSLIKAILRYFLFLISATTIILSFLPFFRKDKKTIQDIITNTTVILEKQ
ncbi:MAG: RDD family protein [Arcobacter sp.]|nr:MAG: RDD family protein [Arcobacter sp.]